MRRRHAMSPAALDGRSISESQGAVIKNGIVLKACLAAALTAAGGFNAISADNPLALKFSHPREITNSRLPLASLKQDILASEGERVGRTARPDVHKTFKIAGQTVAIWRWKTANMPVASWRKSRWIILHKPTTEPSITLAKTWTNTKTAR